MSDDSADEQPSAPTGTYEGETEKGLRHGFGTYVFPSGARYVGNWERGAKHGIGTFMYSDGSRYEGQWWQNSKHGYGQYFYSNGDVYNGQWSLGQRQGYGLYWDGNRKFHFKGHFSDGNLNGPGLVVMANVNYTGNFVDGKPVGDGIYYLPNGLKIKGHFKMPGGCKTPLWTTSKVGRTFMADD